MDTAIETPVLKLVKGYALNFSYLGRSSLWNIWYSAS